MSQPTTRSAKPTQRIPQAGKKLKSAKVYDFSSAREIELEQISNQAKPATRTVNIRLKSEQIVLLNFLNHHVDSSDAFVFKQALRALALLVQQHQAGTPMNIINQQGEKQDAMVFLNILHAKTATTVERFS